VEPTIGEARKTAQQLAADPGVAPAMETGRPPKDGVSPSFRADEHSSTSAERLVRRLKRDRPDIAEALGRGEYPSARSAAIAAGIVKVPTRRELAQKAVARLTPSEQRALVADQAQRLGLRVEG
jgi:hypothetical protein